MADTAGKVAFGTCGWSDASIVACGRFYPPFVRTSADKLRVYSKTFPCVEVDSTCYAIPAAANVARWVQSVPVGFKFHFKAFGLFCSQGSAVSNLPRRARAHLPTQLSESTASYMQMSAMPAAAVDACWDAFHACISPAVEAGKMGCVLFQFHLSFTPSDSNRRYVEHCRRRLKAGVAMAVEFRCRQWFHPDGAGVRTSEWLTSIGAALVAADELLHETMQPDRAQTGLPPGAVRQQMPIAMLATIPHYFYVRVHRRHGKRDRLMLAEEQQAWATRLAAVRSRLTGPIYFLWGTDWEDAPVVNACGLQRLLPASMDLRWKARLAAAAVASRGSIQALFAGAAAPLPAPPCAAADAPFQSCAGPFDQAQPPVGGGASSTTASGMAGGRAATAALLTAPGVVDVAEVDKTAEQGFDARSGAASFPGAACLRTAAAKRPGTDAGGGTSVPAARAPGTAVRALLAAESAQIAPEGAATAANSSLPGTHLQHHTQPSSESGGALLEQATHVVQESASTAVPRQMLASRAEALAKVRQPAAARAVAPEEAAPVATKAPPAAGKRRPSGSGSTSAKQAKISAFLCPRKS